MNHRASPVAINDDTIPLFGAQTAPEFFVNGYQGVMVRDGIAKISFYTVKFDPQKAQFSRHVAFTLIASAPTIANISAALSSLVEGFKADDLIKIEPNPLAPFKQVIN